MLALSPGRLLRRAACAAGRLLEPPPRPERHRPPRPRPAPLLCCERPQLGGDVPPRVSGPVEIVGWALAPGGPAEVRVFLDGQPLGVALDRLFRPDLGRAFPRHPHLSNTGFILVWEADDTPAGAHTLRIEARAVEGGGCAVVEGVVEVDPACHPYAGWLRAHALDAAALARLRTETRGLARRPLISVLVADPGGDPARLARTLRSVEAQAYEAREIIPVPGAAAALAAALPGLRGEYVTLLEAGEVLHGHALAAAARLLQGGALDLVYADEDTLGGDGTRRERPFCKPGWSPELLLGMNYIGRPWLARTAAVREAGGLRPEYEGAMEYDLLLRLAERARPGAIAHLAEIACSRPPRPREEAQSAAEERALAAACARRGLDAEVAAGAWPGLHRVRRALPARVAASVIVPTRGQAALLRPLLTSIGRSTCRPTEVLLLIAAHDAVSEEVAALAAAHGARILRYEQQGPFSWSRTSNLGAAAAQGELLLFLNDDVQVLEPGWIEALAEQARRPEAGAVGAKLLYRNRAIQHAGIFFAEEGRGGLHGLRFRADDPAVHFGLLHVARECSAVTGACLMTRREVFLELGGFDESFVLTCNDADYCLRARQRGYDVIWTPFAVLQHDEGTTRRDLPEAEDARRFWERWGEVLDRGDPYYNPNLSQRSELLVVRDS